MRVERHPSSTRNPEQQLASSKFLLVKVFVGFVHILHVNPFSSFAFGRVEHDAACLFSPTAISL